MNKATSLYLDLLRTVAALTVVLHHFRWPVFSGNFISFFKYGDEAVIIFFVLSGFVIAYVSEEKESAPAVFIWKRISRLWSVLIPGIIFSMLVDYLAFPVNAGDNLNLIVVAKDTLLFLNENWTLDSEFKSNAVFWSISFEFWYYLFFCCLFLVRGRKGMVLLAILCLVTGYKILLLFPIWMAGVYIFKTRNQMPINKKALPYLFYGSAAFLLIAVVAGPILEEKFMFQYFIWQ